MGRNNTETGSVDGELMEVVERNVNCVRSSLLPVASEQLSGGIVFTVYAKVIELAGRT
jgi:hypothetical protein